ncbi:MAG: fmn-dependent monooxygenase [Subtercola sp.]|jgi:probable F420-dependent oxidoreductase|nr:fmn-dependent monooxygenase [Subtercola sp.]
MKICLNPFMLETWFGGSPRPVIDLIEIADERGFDAVVLPEHILMDPDNLDDYPYDKQSAEGRWFDEMTPFFEATTSLAAIASRTKNVKLQTGVMLAPLRNASVLAKTLSTIDHISDGRVEIGYGVGWLELDYSAEGIAFEGRFGRMTEIAEACKQIWTSAPASYHGKHVNFDNVYSLPFPLQREGIPQWFGVGPSERNIERMARVADGWCPLQVPWDVVADTLPKIKQKMEEFGRDPETFGLRLQVIPQITAGVVDLDATFDTIPTLLDAGATHIEIAALNYVASPDAFPDFVDACIVARDKNS